MKSLKTFSLIALATALLQSCYVAPDSGTWSGDVIYKDAYGRMSLCQQEIKITHTNKILHIEHLDLNCSGYLSGRVPSIFNIEDDKIIYKGRTIGDAKANGSVNLGLEETEHSTHYPNHKVFTYVSWSVQGNRLLLEQKVYRGDIQESISGWLMKSF
ncbi:MAG: hypothetical protein M9962_09175 [Oligoflexia bacterium]|nr:hypothetical protein [Oligoflexia bacterium]